MSRSNGTALSNLRVLEFGGLAPGPYCGLILQQFGADVIKLDRAGGGGGPPDGLSTGKRSIAVNLKSSEGLETVLRLVEKADVLIDPFRPGVLERLGLHPEQVLLKRNPRLIVARLTGWGQTGEYAKVAGHDINYIGLTGLLSLFQRNEPGARPLPPVNVLGDFAGGGMLCAMGIILALVERSRSGQGQVIDAAMVDGVAHLGSFLFRMQANGMYDAENPGSNVLDSGAPFYETYKCKDGKFMAVGAIEPQFYALLVRGLGLENRISLSDQLSRSSWAKTKKLFAETFMQKTRAEWAEVFKPGGPYQDACTTPILSFAEAAKHPHNKHRNILLNPKTDEKEEGFDANDLMPSPAPRLSRTPGTANTGPRAEIPESGQHTRDVLKEFGFSDNEIKKLEEGDAVLNAKL